MDAPLKKETARGDATQRTAITKVTPDDTNKAPTRQAKWQQAHPIARWSHIAVQSALKRGILTRGICSVCGDPKTDAHHEDHRRPLDVEWLCRRHHTGLHAARRRKAGAG